jgi:hypothetical protein
MTIIAVKQFEDLAAFEKSGKEFAVPRPSRCPKGCDSVMRRHTGYERGAFDERGVKRMIFVERFLCSSTACGKTVSCLFDFLIPYVQFTIQAVAGYVEEYLSTETTYEELAWTKEQAGLASKSSIWRWVHRLAERAEKLSRAVQQEAVLSNVDNAQIEPIVVTCPNSYKARKERKAIELSAGAACMALAERLLVCFLFEKDRILTVLHRYFVTTAETVWSIFTGRKSVVLSIQQSSAYAIF